VKDGARPFVTSVGEGTTFLDTIKRGVARGEVVEYQKPTRVAFRQTVHLLGMRVLESRPRYELSESNGKTHVHHVAEGNGIGVFRLVEAFFKPVARAERERTVRALKLSLEHASR